MILKELISKTAVGTVIISELPWEYFLTASLDDGRTLISAVTCNGTGMVPSFFMVHSRTNGLRAYSEGRVWVMDVSLPPNMTARAWMEIEGAQVSSLRIVSTLMPVYPVLFVEICR